MQKQAHNISVKYQVIKSNGGVICTLTTPLGKVRTGGGGYNLLGAALGEYLNKLLTQDERQMAADAGFYGISAKTLNLDGATGCSAMFRIAGYSGWQITELYEYNSAGKPEKLIGFQFTPTDA